MYATEGERAEQSNNEKAFDQRAQSFGQGEQKKENNRQLECL
jgi:hypothetical protein